ncbi:MAG: PqqD family protein [Myxococcota bacterium]
MDEPAMKPPEPSSPEREHWAVDPEVVAERVGDAVVLVHLKTNRIFELTPTAARIFELLRAGESRREIERRLLDEYDVAPDKLAAELDGVLDQLRSREIVR